MIDNKIPFEISLIYNIPEQSYESFEDDVRFLLDIGVHPKQILCYPLRIPFGSQLKKNYGDYDIEIKKKEEFIYKHELLNWQLKTYGRWQNLELWNRLEEIDIKHGFSHYFRIVHQDEVYKLDEIEYIVINESDIKEKSFKWSFEEDINNDVIISNDEPGGWRFVDKTIHGKLKHLKANELYKEINIFDSVDCINKMLLFHDKLYLLSSVHYDLSTLKCIITLQIEYDFYWIQKESNALIFKITGQRFYKQQ